MIRDFFKREQILIEKVKEIAREDAESRLPCDPEAALALLGISDPKNDQELLMMKGKAENFQSSVHSQPLIEPYPALGIGLCLLLILFEIASSSYLFGSTFGRSSATVFYALLFTSVSCGIGFLIPSNFLILAYAGISLMIFLMRFSDLVVNQQMSAPSILLSFILAVCSGLAAYATNLKLQEIKAIFDNRKKNITQKKIFHRGVSELNKIKREIQKYKEKIDEYNRLVHIYKKEYFKNSF